METGYLTCPRRKEFDMSAGLFTVCCPECGVELHLDESGNGTCADCAHMYLNRLGYLIPVEIPIDQNSSIDSGTQ
jgi:hypothetical protein